MNPFDFIKNTPSTKTEGSTGRFNIPSRITSPYPIDNPSTPSMISDNPIKGVLKSTKKIGGEVLDTTKGFLNTDPREQQKIAYKASAEFGRSAGEEIYNFFSKVGDAVVNHTIQPVVDSSLETYKKPNLPKLESPTLSHETEKGYEPAHIAGKIVGGTAPYVGMGAALSPLTATLEESSPIIKYVGHALINAGIPALVNQAAPLQEGETRLNRFYHGLPSDIAFGLTSIIPNKAVSAIMTGLSQYGIGATQGVDNAQNILNSAVLTVFGLVGSAPLSKLNESISDPVGETTKRAKEILDTPLGDNPTPRDSMLRHMAETFIKIPDTDKLSFINQAKALYEHIKNTPNKQGGFVKNPMSEEGPKKETSLDFIKKPLDEVITPPEMPQTPSIKDFIKKPVKQVIEVKKPPIEEYKGETDLTVKTLQKLEGRSSVSKQFISDLTNSGDIKQAERNTIRKVLEEYPDGEISVKEFANKVKSELLPLKTKDIGGSSDMSLPEEMRKPGNARYENITLPEEQRGNVANYNERIYESPIKTSAGNVHFSHQPEGAGNYFAHTRIEDMADENTRRVIETQSDLFQKGRLEHEIAQGPKLTKIEKSNIRADELIKKTEKRDLELSKLEPYRNTWHERIIREEIKQAAKDGKTKLQFPTGETAMKIEGLGSGNTLWGDVDKPGHMIQIEDLKPGKEIVESRPDPNNFTGDELLGNHWIITDVLGDGKFKAVPKHAEHDGNPIRGEWTPDVVRDMRGHSMEETFDISGKVDTNNPIYRFYEKEVGRYLAKNYNAQKITDSKGVSWWEVNVSKDKGEEAVTAYRDENSTGFNISPEQAEKILRKYLTEDETSLITDSFQKLNVGGFYRPRRAISDLISLLERDGKVSESTIYHEIGHNWFKRFVTPNEQKAIINSIIDSKTIRPFLSKYKDRLYPTLEKKAEEWLMDNFSYVERMKNLDPAAKTLIQRFKEFLKSIYRKLTKADEFIEKVRSGDKSFKNEVFGSEDVRFDEAYDPENKPFKSEFSKEEEKPVEEKQFTNEEVDTKKAEVQSLRETLNQNPVRKFMKYVSRTGLYEGIISEKAFAKLDKGLIQEAGIEDYNDINNAIEKYQKQKERLEKSEGEYAQMKSDQIDYKKRKLYEKLAGEELDIETKDKLKNEAIVEKTKNVQEAQEFFRNFNLEDVPVIPDSKKIEITRALGDPDLYNDISGFKGQARDIFRNFKAVFGKDYNEIKRVVLDPFDDAKGEMVNEEQQLTDALKENIVDKYGFKKRSKFSAAIQDYGEKTLPIEEVVRRFGPTQATKIKAAAEWFRGEYDRLLDEVNAVRKEIYPRNPEKLIPKRPDYFRHFQEIGSTLEGLKNVFETPSQIDPSLSGISPFTKPQSKFLSFAQKRLGIKTKHDAIGGYLDYIRAAAYAKHIDPHIGVFRALAKELSIQTEENRNLNNFIEFLQDYSNDLAGKSNPADRFIQKVIPGGRMAFKAIDWINKRVKANVILANASSAIAQIFNVPQGIGLSKQHAVYGFVRTLTQAASKFGFKITDPMDQSRFIKERYKESMYSQFDEGMIQNSKKFAAWMIGVLDEVGTKFNWNSLYEKASREGMEDPIRYADEETRKLVAGRGVGEVPLGQKSKIMQFIAPFQLEVGNYWWVMKDFISAKDFGGLLVMFLITFLLNKVAEKIRGSDVAFDPINAIWEGEKIYNSEPDHLKGLLKAGGRMAGEVVSNVPFGQTVASLYPEYGGNVFGYKFPPRSEFFGKGDPTRYGGGILMMKGLQDPLFKLLPAYGGLQLERMISGAKALAKGGVYDSKGNKEFSIPKNIPTEAQAVIFGPNSIKEAQDYFDKKNKYPSTGDFIDEVSTYAHALGADPVTFFNRVFTGQKIRRVDNGAIIVERMSFKDSEAVKKERGSTGSMKLDHTIPLELGGSNSKDNLKLVSEEEWKSYSPMENYLGKKLKEGVINKKEAQDLIKQFKAGKISAEDIRSVYGATKTSKSDISDLSSLPKLPKLNLKGKSLPKLPKLPKLPTLKKP